MDDSNTINRLLLRLQAKRSPLQNSCPARGDPPKPQTMLRYLNCFLPPFWEKENCLEKQLPGGPVIGRYHIVRASPDKLDRLLAKHYYFAHIGSQGETPLLSFRSVPVGSNGGHHLYKPGAWEGIHNKYLRE